MKRIFYLFLALSVLTLFLSGSQSIGGYYLEPSGYGFYHAELGFLQLSLASTITCAAILYSIIKRLDRYFW